MRLRHIGFSHGTKAGERRSHRELVLLDHPAHRHVLWEGGELDRNKLLRVEGAMVVTTLSHRFGQHNSRCVYRMPDVVAVDPACHLADEHRRETCVEVVAV